MDRMKMKAWAFVWHLYFAYFLIIKFGHFEHWKHYRNQNLRVESYRRENRKTIRQEAFADAWWCLG